jgi:NAD-dependent DNA ligase
MNMVSSETVIPNKVSSKSQFEEKSNILDKTMMQIEAERERELAEENLKLNAQKRLQEEKLRSIEKEEEKLLELRGAKIGSSVSKNTTHLICKDPNSGSSKLEKAKSLGIEIMSVDDLNILLKKVQ